MLHLCDNPLQNLAGLAQFRFLKELRLQHCDLERADDIREATSLTALHLSNNHLKTLDFCQGLRYLTFLDASRNELQSPSPEAFSSLTNIQELRLGEFPIFFFLSFAFSLFCVVLMLF